MFPDILIHMQKKEQVRNPILNASSGFELMQQDAAIIQGITPAFQLPVRIAPPDQSLLAYSAENAPKVMLGLPLKTPKRE